MGIKMVVESEDNGMGRELETVNGITGSFS